MRGRPRVLFYGHTRIVSGAERMLLTMVMQAVFATHLKALYTRLLPMEPSV